ncbi:MFS transporter [Actinoplanes sp. NPDC051411]|uniref:MFS transporter n=1 Tax=Actinoplanes sp. NPDC051411 TaxID=3155522 RepID=UPI00341A16D1
MADALHSRAFEMGPTCPRHCFLALALTSSPYLAGLCMAVIGGSFTIGTVAAVSTRQQLVPDHMLGRVVNVFRLIGNGAAPIGAAVGGVIAARYAMGAPIVVGGLLTIAVAGLSLLPKFRRSAADSEPQQAAQR